MNRKFLILAILVAGASAVAGCGSRPAKWDAEAAQYAQYATQIPLYPGTKIVDAMGSESWGDEADSYSYGMTWWCETKATRDELLAWYAAQLPNAERSNPFEDEVVQLEVTPQGARPGETMGVQIGEDGKYRVYEDRKKKEIHRS